jgi:hypothetical protein
MQAMESRDDLTVFTYRDALFHRWQGAQVRSGGFTVWPAIAPDGSALCWDDESVHVRRPVGPLLTVQSIKGGNRPVWLEDELGHGFLISSEAEIIIVNARSSKGAGQRLLALDLRTRLAVHDLTPFVTEFGLPEMESGTLTGAGTLLALGSQQQVQVLRIANGETLHTGPGRYPRLSPDGKYLAFISGERLYVRSLADGSTRQLLSAMRVVGIGAWSPDSRFLPAGVWISPLALDKSQVVVEMTSGKYGEIERLSEGDDGHHFAWIATKLMAR